MAVGGWGWGASFGDHKSRNFSQTKGDVGAVASGHRMSTKPSVLDFPGFVDLLICLSLGG